MKCLIHHSILQIIGSVLVAFSFLSPLLGEEKEANQKSCVKPGICHQLFMEEDSIFIRFTNQTKNIPLTLKVRFKEVENVDIREDELEITIPPDTVTNTESYKIKNISDRWSIRYPFHFYYGDLNLDVDKDYVYRLPYNGRYVVTQGYKGKFTHKDTYALDINMPEKTPILAARDGVVIDFADHFTEGRNDESFKDKGNFVTILHDDGSIAQYVHLYPKSVFVKIDQRIKKGETIGLSGNTGYSTAPHLHFQVSKPYRSWGKVNDPSIPTLFQTESSNSEYLKEQNYYWHEDLPLENIPLVLKETVKICKNYTKEGEVFNCDFKIPSGENIVVQLSVTKPRERKFTFSILHSLSRQKILYWNINAESDWANFYTYTTLNKIPPGNYSLLIEAGEFTSEPIDFIVTKGE